ncbi:hypothetical protein IJ579_00080 [bacterium]|nr:hypothetical protein [bacterium]
MFSRFKNLKLVQKLRETVSPRLRWLSFANSVTNKSSADYLQSVSGVELQSMQEAKELEMMIREQLKKEFPGIENKKSYELLVDAVMNNMMKKQLEETENLDIE